VGRISLPVAFSAIAPEPFVWSSILMRPLSAWYLRLGFPSGMTSVYGPANKYLVLRERGIDGSVR